MPYCRRCGNKLEEDWHFCHKCGTPIATFTPTPPAPANPMRKDPLILAAIILVAILVVVVIVGVLILALFYPLNFNQTNGITQPNVNWLNLDFSQTLTKIFSQT